VTDSDGKVARHTGTAVDITKSKQLEEQIIESRSMYQSVVDTQQEMICRYLPDTTLTFVNEAYCRAFGKKDSELVGKKYLMFIPPEIHEEELASLKRLSHAYPKEIREFEVTLPDGSTGWQHWTDIGVFDDSGVLIEIQGTGYDITERKRAEEEARYQSHRSEVLLRIASHMNAELELDKVKSIICEEACSALHMQKSGYLRYDSITRLFHLSASSGLPEEVARAFEPLSQDEIDSLFNKLGKSGVIADLTVMSELPFAQTMLCHNIRTCAYSFVERDGLPLGILIIWDDKMVNFHEDTISILSGIAHQAASAVTNARLYSEAKNRLSQVQALRNIDLAITGSLDLRVTLQVVLDEVTKMLQTDAAAILRLDPHTGTLKYEHWRGFRSKNIDRITIPLGEGYMSPVVIDRKSVHIHDLCESEQDLSHIPFITDEGFVAYYAVPLIAKGTVLGVLEVFHRERIASNGEWLAFLETLAGQAAIAVDNAELFTKLERSNVDLLRAYDATIEGWAHALDLKDEETEEHSQRVTELTLRIAGKMGIKGGDLAHVRRGALLHDIGKMGIPDNILLKPGKLTDEEWVIMRKHPIYAFEMLSSIDYLRPALDIPYCHHEKWDGSGYPRGIKGKQIPLEARIFAVVDVFDALTSDRPYRKAWTREKTLEHIRELSGTHFDPQVVNVFEKEMDGLA
jgi:PAS domain S-box-containing protein/putative nucleotidyltransferase with HDIG domain